MLLASIGELPQVQLVRLPRQAAVPSRNPANASRSAWGEHRRDGDESGRRDRGGHRAPPETHAETSKLGRPRPDMVAMGHLPGRAEASGRLGPLCPATMLHLTGKPTRAITQGHRRDPDPSLPIAESVRGRACVGERAVAHRIADSVRGWRDCLRVARPVFFPSGHGRPRVGPIDHQAAFGEEPLSVLLDEFI